MVEWHHLVRAADSDVGSTYISGIQQYPELSNKQHFRVDSTL
jgi:hypothetical protein